jgi:6-phosphogluconolactonase
MSEHWVGVDDVAALRETALRRIVALANRAIESRGRFLVALAGGQTPRGVYAMLRGATTDWSLWHVYFGDERCLAPHDPARNSRMAADAWLDHVPIARERIFTIAAELGATAAAAAYARTLRGVAEFDLVLLGLGGDGHTASLFPGHPWGALPGSPDVLAITDAPKPPPQRVSMSAARLSRARVALFMVDGEDKRDAVARWRSGADIPARSIKAREVEVLAPSAFLG